MMETDSGTQLQVSTAQEVSVNKNTGDKKVSNMETELLFCGKKLKNRKTRM